MTPQEDINKLKELLNELKFHSPGCKLVVNFFRGIDVTEQDCTCWINKSKGEANDK